MLTKVEIGKKYFHHKDKTKFYKVLEVGKLQINDERYDLVEVVIYKALYEDASLGKIWVRPISEFLEKFSEVE